MLLLIGAQGSLSLWGEGAFLGACRKSLSVQVLLVTSDLGLAQLRRRSAFPDRTLLLSVLLRFTRPKLGL